MHQSNVVIGVSPSIDGRIVAIEIDDEGKQTERVYKVPLKDGRLKNKKVYDSQGILSIFLKETPILICIDMPNTNNCVQAYCYGVFDGIASGSGAEVIELQPSAWRDQFAIPKKKKLIALDIARYVAHYAAYLRVALDIRRDGIKL